MSRWLTRSALVVALAALTGCGALPRVRLPELRQGADDPRAASALTALAAACVETPTTTAEIAVSGRVGRQRVRATLHVGLGGDGRVRLEAIAPFGVPVFIVAADRSAGTLLMPRDELFVRDVPLPSLLDALLQLPLTADDITRVVLGCPPALSHPGRAQLLMADWVAGRVQGDLVAYARLQPQPTLTGLLFPRTDARARRIAVGYGTTSTGQRRIDVEVGESPEPAATLRFVVKDLEEQPSLPPSAFTVVVPPGARAISLADLRRLNPFVSSGDRP